MTSAKKILAVAIVAMFVASGFIVVAGNDANGDDANGDVAVVNAQGAMRAMFDGVWALNEAMSYLHATGEEGYYIKLFTDHVGQSLVVTCDDAGNYKVNLDDGTLDIDSKVTIDLNRHTFTVNKPYVERPGAMLQSIQLPPGFELTFKNGKIKSVDGGANLLLANHGKKLTLDNVVLDGRNLVQGHSGETYADVYTLYNDCENVVITNSTILADMKPLEGDMSAYALNISGKTASVQFRGVNTITGNIEYACEAKSDVRIFGTTVMTTGKIVKGPDTYDPQMSFEDGSELLLRNGAKICELTVDSNFKLTDIVAGDGGMAIAKGPLGSNVSYLSIVGNISTDAQGSIANVSQGSATLGIGGVVGKGVTMQLDEANAIIIGAIRISEGAIWSMTGKVVGSTDESFLVIEKGAKYQGQTATENKAYRVDTNGRFISVFLVLFETTDHVESITYNGTPYYYSEGDPGAVIHLSQVKVVTESGYKLVGFNVGGWQYGTDSTAVISTTGTVITAVVEEESHPADPSDDGKLALIGAIIVFVIGVLLLALVFSKKTH